MVTDDHQPCRFCGHPFDHEYLGKYGCPNCEGSPMTPGTPPVDPQKRQRAPGAGRPKLPKAKLGGTIPVYLLPHHLKWLKRTGTNRSKAIRELIDDAIADGIRRGRCTGNKV